MYVVCFKWINCFDFFFGGIEKNVFIGLEVTYYVFEDILICFSKVIIFGIVVVDGLLFVWS